ncbi:MAG: chemotaxis protein CheX [Aliarcobacter sp.]|nr:chemotaxis protein CheX [Aliarcobacter sp.]
MFSNAILDSDEKDCLQELMNISYGVATAAITQIVNKFATLNIPKIEIVNTIEFREYLNKRFNRNSSYFVCSQLLNGHIAGENMFIMDDESIYNLTKEFGLDESEINEDELKDIMLEISNIISTTTISKLCELLDSSVIFSPPSISIVSSMEKYENKYEAEYQHIIIIATELLFEDQNIHGELIILSKDDSILFIKDAIKKILDEY